MGKYQKLVRDRIPEIIKENGEAPVTRVLSESEYKEALAEKLSEESEEVAEASTREAVMKELADVLEVVEAAVSAWGIDQETIQAYKKKKRDKRGGFTERIYLEDVTN